MKRVVALLGLALAAACGRATPPETGYLAQVHGLQVRADQARSAGSVDAAHDALLEAALLRPPSEMPADEVRPLRQDAYSQLAALELARGRPAEALKQAQSGLDLGASQDVFAAALLASRGRAAEALGRDAEATRDYDAAIRLDEALLAQDPKPEATP